MPRGKSELAEQIIPKLREGEVEAGTGKSLEVVDEEDCRLPQVGRMER